MSPESISRLQASHDALATLHARSEQYAHALLVELALARAQLAAALKTIETQQAQLKDFYAQQDESKAP